MSAESPLSIIWNFFQNTEKPKHSWTIKIIVVFRHSDSTLKEDIQSNISCGIDNKGPKPNDEGSEN